MSTITTQPISLTLPMPSHDLTLNRITKIHHKRARALKREHRGWARYAALALPGQGIAFPGRAVRCDVAIERKHRQQRWDDSAVIEALKAYIDGIEDSQRVYTDDRQVVWGSIAWDDTPTGTGIITLTFTPEAA